LKDAPAGDRIDASAGEGGGHDGEVATGHGHGTLAEVEIQGFFRIAFEDFGISQQMGDGPVAMAGITFRLIDGLIHLQRVSGGIAEEFEQCLATLLRGVSGHETGRGNGAGIDHRVERASRLGIQADGIEGLAGGFDSDLGKHPLQSAGFESQAINQRLGNRLNRERDPTLILPRKTFC